MKWNDPADETLDAIGLLCPLPVLRARRALLAMSDDAVLEIHTTDSAALIDVPHFCHEAGHIYLGSHEHDEYCAHRIRKSARQPKT